ncbi:M14 family metallopeptidase [Parahaliea aestuarii]|uniref:M14 family metallocarboxypeptidase n=1 Tax=Parahaliea aestuarii TaxID=1852021 RepID=A0A5C8ZU71_9GAMM|nr:M14 family metallocarboxypeptidase [Parahaliea aestuarii]TXS91112.1 M14 family metallocarboxypeptidase [Parahaliea aestuarii]
MSQTTSYSIGTPGTPWGDAERAEWHGRQGVKRSYASLVLSRLEATPTGFERVTYGALSHDPQRYPLLAFRSQEWDRTRPSALVTGGVHGYETSGVQGAIDFLQQAAEAYLGRVNLLVLPCISPWAFETINRWNPLAIDPNRSFHVDSPAEESAAVLALLAREGLQFDLHIDLHETTDTDASEFRPALAARDGESIDLWEHIPDGFYLVGDSERPEPAFQAAVIKAVEAVTHIAPPDSDGTIIGETLEQHGVINYPVRKLGLCAGITDARFVTTTEVYPDSPRVDDANCNLAQVTAICTALDFLLEAGRG